MQKVKPNELEKIIKYHEEKLAEAMACNNGAGIACHRGALKFFTKILKGDEKDD